MSAILPETQLYLPAYSNHLTITTTYLPYYQRHNYTYLPTATTLQLQPHVYHTTRDTTMLTYLQQPLNNNNHMSTILPEIQLYLPAYSNHLTITTTCLPYYQRHNYTYLPTIVPETQLYLPASSNHLTITTTCLLYYQRHNYTYLPTATTLQ